MRPVVALPRGGPALVADDRSSSRSRAMLLFSVLDARRRALTAPAVQPRAVDATGTSAAPPPLYVAARDRRRRRCRSLEAPPAPAPAPRRRRRRRRRRSSTSRSRRRRRSAAAAAAARRPTSPALVVDTGAAGRRRRRPPARRRAAAAEEAAAARRRAGVRPVAAGAARAGMFANRGTTVPQGTLIPAVLETALDSTRPGFARAIVSRDVRGFDGSRVLIPRGSRLIGEYRSDVQPGQHRALVNWTRLIRPDGVTIAIGSPAADTLGGGGIRANVNSHFFARFAGAILQSVLDVGVNLAGRRRQQQQRRRRPAGHAAGRDPDRPAGPGHADPDRAAPAPASRSSSPATWISPAPRTGGEQPPPMTARASIFAPISRRSPACWRGPTSPTSTSTGPARSGSRRSAARSSGTTRRSSTRRRWSASPARSPRSPIRGSAASIPCSPPPCPTAPGSRSSRRRRRAGRWRWRSASMSRPTSRSTIMSRPAPSPRPRGRDSAEPAETDEALAALLKAGDIAGHARRRGAGRARTSWSPAAPRPARPPSSTPCCARSRPSRG